MGKYKLGEIVKIRTYKEAVEVAPEYNWNPSFFEKHGKKMGKIIENNPIFGEYKVMILDTDKIVNLEACLLIKRNTLSIPEEMFKI